MDFKKLIRQGNRYDSMLGVRNRRLGISDNATVCTAFECSEVFIHNLIKPYNNLVRQATPFLMKVGGSKRNGEKEMLAEEPFANPLENQGLLDSQFSLHHYATLAPGLRQVNFTESVELLVTYD